MSTELTDERGKRYGKPLKHFHCTQSMYAEWMRSRIQTKSGPVRNDVANGVNHAVYMIIDKLARASEDPTHIDNWRDIQGYAECAIMILEGKDECEG